MIHVNPAANLSQSRVTTPSATDKATSLTRSYWRDSRSPRYSVTFALPLLVAYELLAMALGTTTGGVRNGADVLIKSVFLSLFGRNGPLIFGAILIGVCAWLVVRDLKGGRRIRPAWFALMMAEAVVLAMAFGVVVGIVSAQILSPFAMVAQTPGTAASPSELLMITRVMVSLGAGLYEELLFRVVLVGALLWAGKRLMGWGPFTSGMVAVLAGALIFSAFHYVGPYGDPLEINSFTFRAVAGVAFSGLYVMRGFGITAWTHALYDLMLLAIQS